MQKTSHTWQIVDARYANGFCKKNIARVVNTTAYKHYRVQTLPRTNVYQLALKFKEILIIQMNHVT